MPETYFFIPAVLDIAAPPRGGGTQAAGSIVAQSVNATFAWGSAPGTATVVYIPTEEVPSITRGSRVTISLGALFFAGICQEDMLNHSTQGRTRTLQFVDFRDYLTWDYVFGAFNQEVTRMVNGVRLKWYEHVLPVNFSKGIKTTTQAPLLAHQIVGYLLGARVAALSGGFAGGTVGTKWSWDLTSGGEFPAGVLNAPVYGFDALQGKRLDAALNEICERTGTVFTLRSSAADWYHLVFTRKGYGTVPAFPADSDDRHVGEALSGHATNVRVLGDRNRYLQMDCPLVPDWSRAWEEFLTVEALAENLYQNYADPQTGTRYNAFAGDTEHFVGRNLAMERALRITVYEYAVLRGDATFNDFRMFAGRPRQDMPAALYLQTLVLRAFRPDFTTFTNYAGDTVAFDQVTLVDQQLCAVDHNPVTGAMGFYPGEPAEGNGYAISRGVQIGEELLRQIRPEHFDPTLFSNTHASRLWNVASYQIDNSGEGGRFLIFDQPLFLTENLFTNDGTDGLTVLNAGFALVVPAVKAALTFEAEPFSYWAGVYPNVSRDTVETVANLRRELVVQGGAFTEIPYADGALADAKAAAVANGLLQRQYVYAAGGYRHYWRPTQAAAAFGTALSSMIDRVVLETGPRGTWQVVDFTTERGRDHFEPERDLERRTALNSLFPGQAQLREQANQFRKLAAAFKQSPRELTNLLVRLLRGEMIEPTTPVWFKARSGGAALPSTTMLAGTPLRGSEGAVATYPGDVDPAVDKNFLGIVVRQNEPVGRQFPVQTRGRVPCRVMGPINANDSVGLAAEAADWLVKDGTPNVGKAVGAISTAEVKLILCDLGSGGGGAAGEYIECVLYDVSGTTLSVKKVSDMGGNSFAIAKAYHLRNPGSEVIDGVTVTYTYISVTERLAKINGVTVETQIVLPRFKLLGRIFAVTADSTGLENLNLLDANNEGRVWARKYA